ncbi:interferon-induced, double-stranded RNA-activated protein kinase isoform X2 [Octodon degus]|uniref:Interferon-induced, double-stranded RNA-activated protein kinase isoform X2 n=1 Tax=Octodon degus TaxID=10160 RepID=A0A6P6E3W9_OCTDE|nr:interferon-induced, double-stranded RNA-activated protein kinase isoform X2 [Octodon degus]
MASALSPGFYIGELNKYQQKYRVKVSYQQLSVTGPPHNSLFTIQVIIDGRTFPEGEGRTKQEAKNAAAKIAFDTLNQEKKATNSSVMTNDASEGSVLGNYIGILNSFAQRERIAVNYEQWEQREPGAQRFYCKCKIDQKIYGCGTASTKQEAKQLASKHAYARISEEGLVKTPQASTESCDSGNSSSKSLASESPSESDDWTNSCKSNQISGSEGVMNKQQKVKVTLAPKFNHSDVENSKYTVNDWFTRIYENIELIGKGGYGEVFKAIHKLDKTINAIKRTKYNGEKELREVQALAAFTHPNIVQYRVCWYGEDYDPECSRNINSRLRCTCLFISMEFCDKGTLEQWIEQRRGENLDKALALEFFEQITRGVDYIHSKDIIHRDLKPANIFLVDEKHIKIGDFGLATSLKSDEKRTRERGTERYMSPEQIDSENYGKEVDIYALGLIFGELIYICKTCQETAQFFRDLRKGIFYDVFNSKEVKKPSTEITIKGT